MNYAYDTFDVEDDSVVVFVDADGTDDPLLNLDEEQRTFWANHIPWVFQIVA